MPVCSWTGILQCGSQQGQRVPLQSRPGNSCTASETMTEPTSHHPQPHLGSSRQTGTGAAGGECQGLSGHRPAHTLRKGWETEGRGSPQSTFHATPPGGQESQGTQGQKKESHLLPQTSITPEGWPKPSPGEYDITTSSTSASLNKTFINCLCSTQL